MPPPPPPRQQPDEWAPQPPGYPAQPTPYATQPVSYAYSQPPAGPPPLVSRPPGVAATANVLGAIGGLVVTALATGVLLHASTEIANRYSFLGEARVGDVLLLLVGVVLLGSVVIGGRFAPAGPIVSGSVLLLVGLVAVFSTDFGSWLFRNYPIDDDQRGLVSWIALGSFIVVGGLMIASGIASTLGRRR